MTTQPKTRGDEAMGSADIGAESLTAEPTTLNSSRQRTMMRGFLALMNQGFVSGGRFATSILVGRYAGRSELGVYSLGFSLLVTAICAQESLISAPYTIYHGRRRGRDWNDYNGSSLIHHVAMSLIAMLIFSISAQAASRWPHAEGLPAVLAVLAMSTPFALLREFARRMEFARLRLGIAVWIDGSVAVLQVALLAMLAHQGQLNARTAFAAVGIASAACCLIWLYLYRRDFQLVWRQATQEVTESWRIGKWIFLAQLVGLLHIQGMLWIVTGMYDAATTGLFAACTTLVLFSNPFALGINNLVSPLAVQAVAKHGLSGVRRLIGWAMLAMGLSILVFCAAMFWGSDWIMWQLFHDPSYAGQRWLVLILGLNMTLTSVQMVNDGGLWAMERPEVVFRATVLTVAVTFLLAFPLIHRWELVGAALSLLIGRTAGAICEAWVFFVQMSDASSERVSRLSRAKLTET